MKIFKQNQLLKKIEHSKGSFMSCLYNNCIVSGIRGLLFSGSGRKYLSLVHTTIAQFELKMSFLEIKSIQLSV